MTPSGSILERLAGRGDAVAVRMADRELTAAELVESVGEPIFLHELSPVELQAGDVVALRGANPFVQVAVPLAAWQAGLHTFFVSDREPEEQLQQLLVAAGSKLYVGWNRASGHVELATPPDPSALPGPTSTLLRTSGSRAAPRIAVHDLGDHLTVAERAATFFELGGGDSWLLSLPLHHVGGLGILMRCLVSGAALACPAEGMSLTEALAHYEPTHISLVATQLRRLLGDDAAIERLVACRAVLMGGAAIPAALREEALERGVPLVVSYGATETAALVTAGRSAEIVRREASAGRPLPGRAIAIGPGGEILVGGEGLFRGYLEAGEISGGPTNGLLETGDVGRLGEDGVLYVDGRRDRQLVSGGENIQPEEIEAALLSLPGITAAAVIAVPDEEFGQRPVAFVGAGSETSASLEAALRRTLPGFKVPDVFYDMPRSALEGMKPDLLALEALARDGSSLRRI